MGKCLGCDIKLGVFEGYDLEGEEFCKNCISKSKKFLEEKEERKEKEKKEQEEQNKKEERRKEKSKRLLKKILKLEKTELHATLSKKGKNLTASEKEELSRDILRFKNFTFIGDIIFISILLVYFFVLRGSLIMFILIIFTISYCRLHSWKKKKLIIRLKEIITL